MPEFNSDRRALYIRVLLFFSFLIVFSSSLAQQSGNLTAEKNALLLETAKSLYDTDTKTSVSLSRIAVENSRELSEMEQFNAHLTLAIALIKFDSYSEAEFYLDTSQILSKLLNDMQTKALVSRQFGVLNQHRGNLDVSLDYFEGARAIFQSIPDNSELAKTLVNIGNTYHFQGKNNEALKHIDEAYEIRRKNELPDTIACLVNQGIFRADMGQYPQALELYLDALSTYEARNDEYNISQVRSNLGILYKMTFEFEKAEINYKLALATQEKLGHKRKAHLSHNNLGLLYFEQGKTELALFHFQRALDAMKEIGSYHSLWATLLNLGYYHNEAGNHTKAIDYLSQAYVNSDTSNNVKGKALASIHLASAYDAIGRFDLAKKHGNESIDLSGRYGNLPTLEYALYTIQTIYKNHGKFEDALEIYEKFVSVRDSIINAEKNAQTARLEARFELSEKEQEIQKLDLEKKELMLNDRVFKLQMTILVAALTILLLLGLVYFRTQRAKLREHVLNSTILENEVTSITKQMATKNQMLDNLKSQLEKVKVPVSVDKNANFLSLFKLVETNSKSENDWKSFVEQFDTLHPTFFSRLEKTFPELTNTDLRLAALIKLRLSHKEIAEVVNITPDSVKQSRYRLKKKIGLFAGQDLAKFLYDF